MVLLAGAAAAERPGKGRWEKFRTHRFDASLDDEQRAMIEAFNRTFLTTSTFQVKGKHRWLIVALFCQSLRGK